MAGQTNIILNAVLGDIERGVLNPGDVIEEQQLVDTHKVSRTPVREAVIALEAAGLIKRLPRKGAVIFARRLRNFSPF